MKIALVSDHGSPLSAPTGPNAGVHKDHLVGLSTALVAAGHQVTVFTRRDDSHLPTVCQGPGYRIVHVPAGPPTFVPADELYVHMREYSAFLRRWWAAERPDVAHAHGWMSGKATLEAAQDLGLGCVVTFHDMGAARKRFLGAEDHSPLARTRIEHFVAHHATAIIANCRDEAAELARLGVPPNRASLIPSAVDTALFAPLGEVATTSRRQRILSVGELLPRNGFDELISALAALPHAELVVAGEPQECGLKDDREAKRLRELAKRIGVDNRLTLLGRVPRSQMPALYRSADVVACTPHYEPFGMAALEAMACGRPVVAAAVGALRDTLRDGVTGFLVPPGNHDALAAALTKVLDDKAAAMDLGASARTLATSQFGWRSVSMRTAAVYRLAIERRRTSTSVAG